MNKMKKSMVMSVLFFVLIIGAAYAIPGIPNQFYGTVTYNGVPAPNGLTVDAKIDGEVVASATTISGTYSLIVKDQDNELSGDTVSFFVNGIDAQNDGIFLNGAVIEDQDLSVTGPAIDIPDDDDDDTTTSRGGGGGNLPLIIVTETEDNETEDNGEADENDTVETTDESYADTVDKCQELWECTDWSACEDSIQTRSCIDKNTCGSEIYKPFESQPCTVEEQTSSLPMGQLIINYANSTIGGAAIVAFFAIIGLIVRNKFF